MRLGIFSRPDDRLARHVGALALVRGVELLQVGLQGIAAGVPVAFDGDAWLCAGEDLAELDAVFVRNIPAELTRAAAPGASGDWEERLAQADRASFAESALSALELRGVPIVNPPIATRPYDHKGLQLAAFQRAGLTIPRTIITNYPQAVELFAADVGEVIVKPLGGGHTTRVLDEAARAHLGAIAARPAIFQERVRGVDVRVTVVADRVVSAVEIPTDAIDYRASAEYQTGEQRYVEHALRDAGRELALRAAKTCRHVLSGVDLKHRGGDDYVLLEANSSPVYLAIELATGHPITKAVLDYLLGE